MQVAFEEWIKHQLPQMIAQSVSEFESDGGQQPDVATGSQSAQLPSEREVLSSSSSNADISTLDDSCHFSSYSSEFVPSMTEATGDDPENADDEAQGEHWLRFGAGGDKGLLRFMPTTDKMIPNVDNFEMDADGYLETLVNWSPSHMPAWDDSDPNDRL